jgi:4a-hydroxytetrahydrobiopterin dehydratase
MVTTEEEPALLAEAPGWDIIEIKGVKRLKRVIRVKGWEPAVALANEIARLASESDHHPSIQIEWGKVTVQWWTHAIRGLHRNDFIMAARVNNLIGPK